MAFYSVNSGSPARLDTLVLRAPHSLRKNILKLRSATTLFTITKYGNNSILKMFSNFATIAATTLAVVGLGNAHLIMKHPVPYGVDTLDNSPLHDAKLGSGESDYPCKQRPGVYDITKMNNMAVGEPQLLDFEGTASHGGGTCQIAVTLDKEPDHTSQFKIIQVFEGGCPTSSDGTTESFTFSIPKGFPNGQATLAWSWYNMMGNREMYMNCAPITVTGGSDSQDYYNSLPNMYVINMPTDECASSDGGSRSVIIPNPGQFILKKPEGQYVGKAVEGVGTTGCAAAAAAQLKGVMGYKDDPITDNGAAYGSGGGAAPPAGGSSAAPSYAPSGAPSAGPSGAPSSAPGGYSAAPSSAAAGSSGMATSYAPAPSSAAGESAYPSMVPSGGAGIAPSSAVGSGYASAVPSAAPSGGASGAESCSSSSMACSSDGTKFGLCANARMVWQPVAPGTSCKGGQIVKRGEHRNVHVRRHTHSARRHLAPI
ncbi:hypothetical protein LTR37_006487 [Vermiconidia calcicola]|uniref:Uncharacterized protein n=1 Tax=Vermiconidia calcicola TaxID=1690605 RepID=A0ACC3NHF2_9PEZI|nr:hypothetical protein LTR37_006487 [Vermiconidia calcicola]